MSTLASVAPSSARGAHDRHDRPSAARVLGIALEEAEQTVRVEIRHALDHLAVELLGGPCVLVVRQIAAGHQQRAPAGQCLGQPVAQRSNGRRASGTP